MDTLVKKENAFPELSSLLFDDVMMRDILRPFHGANSLKTIPAVNVRETDKTFELEVAVPGMRKEDFRVELENDTLTVSAEREDEKEEKDKEDSYSRHEFSYQSFQRSFRLPEKMIDGDKMSASYKDGILRITVPKAEQAKRKPGRQIKIS